MNGWYALFVVGLLITVIGIALIPAVPPVIGFCIGMLGVAGVMVGMMGYLEDW